MEKKFFLYKKLNFIMAFMAILFSVSLEAQQSMSLGALQFVMPTSEVKASSRIISMKMGKKSIPSDFISKVGGVAFIQTAQPDFKINSFDLGVDKAKKKAYAVINGKIYEIPLEVWELQSIVNYASEDDNAAVTLYGTEESPIQFHKAFLDNLMGWRILQADLMFHGRVSASDASKLPADTNGEYVLSPQESELYEELNGKYSNEYSMNYESYCLAKCEQARNDRNILIREYNEIYHTYIYTDYDQPIKMNLKEGKIEFTGDPYYRFFNIRSGIVDTMNVLPLIRDFVINFMSKKYHYNLFYYNNAPFIRVFDESRNPKIEELFSQLVILSDNKKAGYVIKSINFYDKYRDCFEVMSYSQFIRPLMYDYCKYIASFRINSELSKLAQEFIRLNGSLRDVDYPIWMSYYMKMRELDCEGFGNWLLEGCRKYVNENHQQLSIIEEQQRFISNYYDEDYQQRISVYGMSYDNALISLIYCRGCKPVLAKVITDYFRKESDLVNDMNPIVFNAAIKVSHWSAFFRFAKETYKSKWIKFVKDVKSLKYDAPVVQTPISINF